MNKSKDTHKALTLGGVALDPQLQIVLGELLQLQPHWKAPGVRIQQGGVYAGRVHQAQRAQVAVEGVADQQRGWGEEAQQGHLYLLRQLEKEETTC